MSFGRAALTVGGLTALSRVAGFGRDLLIAAALGAGPVADAFFVSLKLANFLRRLFAEGAFAAAFVPLYIRLRTDDGLAAATRFAGEALSTLAVVLALVVALGELAMPWLVRGLATGFAPDSLQYLLAVDLARITFPYLLLISLAALFASLLQAGYRFAAAAFAPTLLNLVLIAALLATGARDLRAAQILSWAVLAAGFIQLAWVAAAARRAGLVPALRRPRLSPEVRRLCRMIGPGFVGVGVVQLNLLVASWFASHLPAGTVRVLAPAFFAREDTTTPVRVAAAALAVNLVASAVLAPSLGHVGIALALSLASWVNMLGLGWLLGRSGWLRPDVILSRRIAALVGAVLVMAAVLQLLRVAAGEPGPASLALTIGSASLAFALVAWSSGAIDTAYWRRASRA